MSSLRLALKQSLQESVARNHDDDDDDSAVSSEQEFSSGKKADNPSSINTTTTKTHHSAANTIQSKWKSKSSSSNKNNNKDGKYNNKKKHEGKGGAPHHHHGAAAAASRPTSGEQHASSSSSSSSHGLQQQQQASSFSSASHHHHAAASSPSHHHQRHPNSPTDTKKKQKQPKPAARSKKPQDDNNTDTNNNNDDTSSTRRRQRSQTVPPPSHELMEFQRLLSISTARQHIAPNVRVKVRFATMNKKKKWFGGRISAVSKEGSKVRIKYDDGTTEVTRFPDKDVIVDDTENGEHGNHTAASVFVLPMTTTTTTTRGEEDDHDEDEKDGPAEFTGEQDEEEERHYEKTTDASSQRAGGAEGEDEKPLKRKRGRPPKQQRPTGVEDVAADDTNVARLEETDDPPLQLAVSSRATTVHTLMTEDVPMDSKSGSKTVDASVAKEDDSTSSTAVVRDDKQSVDTADDQAVALTMKDASNEAAAQRADNDDEPMHDILNDQVDATATATSSAPEKGTAQQQQAPSDNQVDSMHVVHQDQSSIISEPIRTQVAAVDGQHQDETEEADRKRPREQEGAQPSSLQESTDDGEPPKKRLHIHSPSQKAIASDHKSEGEKESAGDAAVIPTETAAIPQAELETAVAPALEGDRQEAVKNVDVSNETAIQDPNAPDSSINSALIPSASGVEDVVDQTKKRKREEKASGSVERANQEAVKEGKAGSGSGGGSSSSDHQKDLEKVGDVPSVVNTTEEDVTSDQPDRSTSQDHTSGESVLKVSTSSSKLPVPIDEWNNDETLTVEQLQKIADFDPSLVRSGRRAAQQANERIASRQELIIEPFDDRKGKKKRGKEKEGAPSDNGSEASEDDSQWVQCDKCGKWRIIPTIVVSTLPKQWFCENNMWDQKRASCDAPEQTSKQVAKEKKKRKKMQLRLKMEAEAAAAFQSKVTGDESRRATTPVPGVAAKSKKTTPDATDLDDFAENDKKLGGKKSRQENADVATIDATASDNPGRRGHGRPRRIKEVIKPATVAVVEAPRPRSVGATDDTDNLEWVQCEKCNKWRKLAAHVSADELPDVWYCKMNTWNILSASCDAPEDKADGLQDVGFNSGANAGKLSYRNLIFGNNGRKPNRPISERTRAAESLFMAPNDDEDAPPVVMYANSSAFVVRSRGNPNIVSDESDGNSVLELMSHSNLWAELRSAAHPMGHGGVDNPGNLASYTYDTLPYELRNPMKEFLLYSIGDKCLTGEEILLETQCRKAEGVVDSWSQCRVFCTLNVVVTTLYELTKEGAVECVHKARTSDMNIRYRLTKRQKMKAGTVAVIEVAQAVESDKEPPQQPSSRFMKIAKPWKRVVHAED